MPNAKLIEETRDQIEELQLWFASKPYGWTERCSPEQLQQWTDREREQERLVARLEALAG